MVYTKIIQRSAELMFMYLSRGIYIPVPPPVEGLRLEIAGLTATFSWEPNLRYDNYTFQYAPIILTEFHATAQLSQITQIDIPKDANNFTLSNLANSGFYVSLIFLNYEDLEGVGRGFFFSIGEYIGIE